jgi:prevent-host-death family protein
MKTVKIAELKARLSEFLRIVQTGESIAVLDRNRPVARIVPMVEGRGLRVRKPVPGSLKLNKVPLPKPAQLGVDVLDFLLEERQPGR